MPRFALAFLCLLVPFGCSNNSTETPSSEPSTSVTTEENSTSVTTQDDSTTSEPAESTTDGKQTVQGDGFTFEAPADWKVQKLSAGISVTSPSDFANEILGIPVSFSILPTQPALPPDALIESLSKSDKNLGEVESETTIDISGRPSKKLIVTKAHPEYNYRTIKLYVPLDDKVLVAQSQGIDKHISPVEAEIDNILASLKLTK